MKVQSINEQVIPKNYKEPMRWSTKWRLEKERKIQNKQIVEFDENNFSYKDVYKLYKNPIKAYNTGRLLDGFLLLESCKVELPHEAISAKISSMKIVEVATEDLKYFSNLSTLDASDNRIDFKALIDLVSLVELNLNCNYVYDIIFPEQSFNSLEILHLAYNKISIDSIS